MNRSYILCVLFMALLSCKSRQTASGLEHTVDDPVRDSGKWQWEELTPDEFFISSAPYGDLPGRDMFILDDPLNKRMMFWLEQFDARLRARAKELGRESDFKNVPKPRSIIMKENEANAFVNPVPVCVDVSVRVDPNIAVSDDTTVNYVEFSSEGRVSQASDTPSCVRRQFDDAFINATMNWFNMHSRSCRVNLEENSGHRKVVVVGQGCEKDPELEGIGFARGLVVITTSNWVTVNSGLISFFPEEKMILPTLAHELGHYYRSHMTTFAGEYNFFYQLTDQNPRERPHPNTQLVSSGEKAVQGSRYLKLAEVSNQKFHSALFQPMVEIIERYCAVDESRCTDSCGKLFNKIHNEKFDKTMKEFPEEDPTKEAEKLYLSVEKLFTSCAKTITYSAATRRGGYVRSTELKAAIARSKADQLLTAPTKPKNLFDAFKNLQSQTTGAAETAKQYIQSAFNQRVGYYTDEQEADEFGLEQFVGLGFDPQDFVKSDMFYYSQDDQTNREVWQGVSMAQCSRYRDQHWKDDNGRPFAPPIADYFDSHHSDCYRVFNLDREIEAHRYQREEHARIPQLMEPPKWAELVELAKSMTPGEEPEPPDDDSE